MNNEDYVIAQMFDYDFEHETDDEAWPDERLGDDGCIGDTCLNPHFEHARVECFTAEMAEEWDRQARDDGDPLP